MATRRQIMQAAFRNGAGIHQRCRTAERRVLRDELEDAVNAYYAGKANKEEHEETIENRGIDASD